MAPKITSNISSKNPPSPKNRLRRRKSPKSTAKPESKFLAAEEKADAKSSSPDSFPIVGIGASAGGLEAYEHFFQHMPPDSGMAFILVPHLDPGHTSLMTSLMKKFTPMKVVEIKDGMKIAPNCVYVIPPNKDLAMKGMTLRLSAPVESRSLRLPIDSFFRSLAEEHEERAICIILSGTGSDGTMGLKAIYGVGGLTLVQDPASAKYDGMPKSAASTGLADYVLPVEKMADSLLDYVKRFPPGKPEEMILPHRTPSALQKILNLIRSQTGQDFSLYKKNTLYRRIERRMNLHKIQDAQKYVLYLQEHPEETWSLFKELLIAVTSFFRDSEAFEVLKEKICPKIFENKPEDYSLRVWVTGCSTGEEAYSLAMAIRESLDEKKRNCKLQIFGTDLDENAIDQARRGFFPGNIAIDVSPQRLKRFFFKEENGFRIKKEIRDTVIFAVQNLIKDAPFTKMDLISCRNLLIYLEPELQNKLIPLLHYSLKPGGFLFLGSSESIGAFSDLFSAVDKKWKFFQSKAAVSSAHEMTPTGLPWTLEHARENFGEEKKGKYASVAEVVQKALLHDFSPPSVVIDEKGNILYVHGQTGKYLEPAPGQASLNILDMAREGILFELRSGIHNVLAKNKEVIYRGVQVKANVGSHPINLTIKPLRESGAAPGLMMVVFQDLFPPIKEMGEGEKKRAKVPSKTSRRIEKLEEELSYTKESLQATIEEMQSANEELKSTNEELQSTNEELQSTNEEMETSKEELQSVNEELVTVNSELQAKIEMLSRAESDMRNLLNTTDIGTIFLDQNLGISRFTTEATKVINLIPADIGRPISHLASKLAYENLVADAQEVLHTLIPKEVEVKTKDENYYLMRILPYRTVENVIAGVVITFVNITQLKQATEELQELTARLTASRNYAESIIATVREPLVVLDTDLRVISANQSFYNTFQVTPEETKGKYFYELGNRQWDIPKLRQLLEEILPKSTLFQNFEVQHTFPVIGQKNMLLNARKIVQDGDSPELILLAFEDITERRRAEEEGQISQH